ncbi:MAG: LptF/LptG family permease [Chitinophagaceae bacterium]
MFRKIDKLVIKAFIGPFIATFFITLLVLVLQFFWLYIDDFVGKGLGTKIIVEFIWYQSAVLVPLALPLAILLSSLMTFGNLGESFELVAIKSAGISLLRFMRPLFFVTLFVCGIAFLFSNYIIPVANLKSRTLLSDIVFAKPAFNLKEGVFYDQLSGFAIKIGKKEANDSIIRDVIIYEQGNPLQDNFMIAKSGVMRVTDDKRFLEFNLKDGWRYQERGSQYGSANSEYIRINFKEYNKQFDLSSFNLARTPDSLNKNNEKMYSMRQLNKAIDSLNKQSKKVDEDLQKDMYGILIFPTLIDTAWTKQKAKDTTAIKKVKSLDDLLPEASRTSINQKTEEFFSALRIKNGTYESTTYDQNRNIRKHKIEWHRKIALSFACLVLFLVGAPLGSIIRKGGLGTPMVFAIIFFMVFYFSSTTGEKFAKENTLSPFAGMWMATFILVPIGIFLIYKALRDSQLFNKEFYNRIAKQLRRKKQ